MPAGETIADKTAFEAVETHVHLLDNLSKRECVELEGLIQTLGHTLLSRLHAQYPDRDFTVYVTLSRDTVIARFHQRWPGEPPYYDAASDTKGEKRLCLPRLDRFNTIKYKSARTNRLLTIRPGICS